jgi:integrase
MPRLVHRPPLYRRHKSTNQAVVSLFGDKIYLGPYGSPRSHERYQELLKKWEKQRHQEAKAEGGDGLPPLTSAAKTKPVITPAKLRAKRTLGQPITVNELIYVYRLHTHSYYQKNGEVTREAGVIDDALRILRKHYGNIQATEFGPVALDELRERMIDELDWSRKYLNKQVSRIRSMFKWASAKEILEATIPAALRELAGLKKGRTQARETKRVRVVSDSVVEMTLPELPETVADMVRIQRLTSARPGEICSIAPTDVDTSSEVWTYRPAAHKTEHYEKDRVIAIGPRAQAILQKYFVSRVPADYCFSPAESEIKRRALATASRKTRASCGNRPGTNRVAVPNRIARDHYTTASYRRAIHRACDKLGIEKWSPNRLRHTASTAIRRQFGIDAARAVDGHSAASTTEIYAELDLNKAVEVMRALG